MTESIPKYVHLLYFIYTIPFILQINATETCQFDSVEHLQVVLKLEHSSSMWSCFLLLILWSDKQLCKPAMTMYRALLVPLEFKSQSIA